MSLKLFSKPITDTKVESLAENIHLGFAFAPFIASIATTVLQSDIHLWIEVIFLVLVIIFNFCLLWLRSRTEESKELSLFYTFRKNELLPVQSGEEQRYRVNLAIIEDEQHSYFRDQIKQKYKTSISNEKIGNLISKIPKSKIDLTENFKLEDLVLNEVKDNRLIFDKISVKASKAKNEEKSEQEFKADIDKDLDHPTAVLVVRTKELDEKPWVYKAINSWAFQNSETPILFAKDKNVEFDENETAEKFNWVPDDAQSLAWRLLQRAKERGKAWRIQASYNRAMVWNIFYLALMFAYIAVIWNISQKNSLQNKINKTEVESQRIINQYKIAAKAMDDAIKTEKEYKQFTTLGPDAKLSISYWFRYNGKPYVFVTTEQPHTTYYLDPGNDKIISCGFEVPNRINQWKLGIGENADNMQAASYDIYDRLLESKCKMIKLNTNAIKAIVCATYNETEAPPSNPDQTVGICAFTENEKNDIFQGDYKKFLSAKVKEFNDNYITHIRNKELITLKERESQLTAIEEKNSKEH